MPPQLNTDPSGSNAAGPFVAADVKTAHLRPTETKQLLTGRKKQMNQKYPEKVELHPSMAKPQDFRLPKAGWAPGKYLSGCIRCHSTFIGDKRAVHCADCAYNESSSPTTQPQAKGEFGCLICTKPVPDYEPQFCCSGHECGCMGQPIEPCVCSPECSDAVFDYIGIPMEERRVKAGIELWLEKQKIQQAKGEFGEPWHCESDWTHIRREDTQEIVAAVVLRPTQKNKIPDSPVSRRIVACVNLLAGHDLTKVAVVDKSVLESVERLFGCALVFWNKIYNETNYEDDIELKEANHEEGNAYRIALKSLAKLKESQQ